MQENLPQLNVALGQLAQVDPHLILLLFLPTLIFESAFALETHLFKRMFSQITILAVPGLMLTTALTAALAYYLFPWGWSWPVCFLFGALISATDPVAVVSLLKEVSSRKRLETLIEGESLLNDGTAIVMFTLFYGLLTAGHSADISLAGIAINFFSVVMLGLIIGVAIGALVLVWISHLFNKPMIEITLTISAAYIAYFVAENLFHASGVVAVVSLALLLASVGRTKISPEVADFLHHFWQMMAHIANTLIFILVGIIIASRIRLDNLDWWINLAVLYLGIQVIRAVSVFVFMPVLGRIGIGINKEKAIVLIWGGLRGAVSLALALIVAQDVSLPAGYGDQILFLTAGIVVLTIVINSSTMTMILRYLGLDKLPPAKQASLDKARFIVKQRLMKELPELQNNEFLQRANWKTITNPIESIEEPTPQTKAQPATDSELRVAFYRRLLETERQFYWSQFKQGALTGSAANQLVSAVETALDGEPEISPRNYLFNFWKTPAYMRWFDNVSVINRIIVYFSFERLALRYDTARGFLLAQQEIEKLVPSLAPSDEDRIKALQEIGINIRETRRHIQDLRDHFPDLSFSLETHSAHRLLLHLERVHLEELIEEGILDESEAHKLIDDIEDKIAHLKLQPHVVSAGEITKQIAVMDWADGVKSRSLTTLGKLANRQIFNEGELIYRQNNEATAIAIVVCGKVDVICSSYEEIVTCGGIIGASAFLTGSYKNSAKALTTSEIIWLDISKLKKIIAKDKKLGEILTLHLDHEMHEN